ncbi:MAG: tetratricopeptide repeat protein [Vicinamibacterales bacterium]
MTGVDADARRQVERAYAELEKLRSATAVSSESLAAAHGELGRVLLAAELDDAAGAFFTNAVTLDPREPRWTYFLAHVHRRRGALGDAIAFFERTLALQPDNSAALWWLGTAYLDLGRADEAEVRFSRMLGLQPRALSAVYGLGRAALARNDYAAAVAHFERVLAMNEAATAAHYPLGLAYRGLGRLREAEAHLARRTHMQILPLDPWMNEIENLLESVTASQDRGLRASLSGDWASAVRHFERATELAPANVDARLALVSALIQVGDRVRAAEQADVIERLSPSDGRARALLEASNRAVR